MITEEEAATCGFGPYGVAVIPHFKVKLKDGVHLALKIWFPSVKLTEKYFPSAEIVNFHTPSNPLPFQPCPTILEFIPYRKADFTSERDYRRHPWMASHGYVIVRGDMRGSGDSEGFYFDEYEQQEQDDACELIDWFAGQEWCNGNVGMYGKSWGGFNGLQVAYCQPPALKAVISLYSTDDRYLDDIHFMGGCIPQHGGFFSWAAYMFAMNALPPSPLYDSNWKDAWLERLRTSGDPWTARWLKHQTRDSKWRHASICEDYSRLDHCAVLLIGGWLDGYRNAVFRMVEHLPNSRAIIGPWSHEWPDHAIPGPHIAYMEECKKWWDFHLKDTKAGTMDLPKFRVFMRDGLEPSPVIRTWPGKWLVETKWPPTDPERKLVFVPDSHTGSLLFRKDHEIKECVKTSSFSSVAGMWAGPWLSFGDGFPGDQRFADAISITWYTKELTEDLEILGLPELEVTVSIDKGKHAMVAARLVDVFPNGASTLITHGMLNLLKRDGSDEKDIKELVPGERYKVNLLFSATSYAVAEGHKLGLCVSSSYWPFAWPAKDNNFLSVYSGSTAGSPLTTLTLPILPREIKQIDFPDAPKLGPPMPVERTSPPQNRTTMHYSLTSNEHVLEIHRDTGEYKLSETNTVTRDVCTEKYISINDDVHSCKIIIDKERQLGWPEIDGGINVRAVAHMEMWADDKWFYLLHELKAIEGDDTVFEKKWDEKVSREYV